LTNFFYTTLLIPYESNWNNGSSFSTIPIPFLSKIPIIGPTLFNQTIIFGNIQTKEKPLTRNFINVPLKSNFLSKTNSYINFFYKKHLMYDYEIIEIHNRPEYLRYLIKKKINSKLLIIFHNNPLDIKGSRTKKERLLLLKHSHKILFVSKWVMNKFFQGLGIASKSNCEIAYPSINPVKNLNKNKKNKSSLLVNLIHRKVTICLVRLL
jgi:hypothetical protein